MEEFQAEVQFAKFSLNVAKNEYASTTRLRQVAVIFCVLRTQGCQEH